MMMRAVFVLLVLGLSDGDVVLRDSASSRRSASSRTTPSSNTTTPTFTDSELKCFIKQQVLYTDGNCYTIRDKGPCAEGQWLVLDHDDKFVPNGANRRRLVCKALPCDRPGTVFWPEDGQCHRLSEKTTLCPFAENKLRRNSFGEGECTCETSHIRFKPEVLQGANGEFKWNGACYPLYRRGPCQARKVLIAEYLPGFGSVGGCLADPCKAENSREAGSWYAKRGADSRCYQLGVRGPCADAETFKVNELTHRAECLGRSHTSLTLIGDSPMRCDGNIDKMTQECREETIVKIKSMPFTTEVSGRVVPRRRTRSS